MKIAFVLKSTKKGERKLNLLISKLVETNVSADDQEC